MKFKYLAKLSKADDSLSTEIQQAC